MVDNIAEKTLEPVNVIVGRFQPFTLGHIKGAEQVYGSRHNLPGSKSLRTVFLIIDTPESKTDSRHPFTSERIIKDNSVCTEPWFAGMYTIKNADIGKIASVCRDNGFEPVMWTCGTDRYSQYSRQAVPKYIDMYNLSKDFKVNEIARTDEDISASAVRKALKDDDRKAFEKMMPKWVWDKYDEYKDIVSAVKERQRTLTEYIKENIYGNLGIDDSIDRELGVKWVEKFNKSLIKNHITTNSYKAKAADGMIYLPVDLYICDDTILEDGHLPDGFDYRWGKSYWGNAVNCAAIHIYTPEFKSFKNLPAIDKLRIKVDFEGDDTLCGITDWSTDFNTVIHELEIKTNLKNIKGLDKKIGTLVLYRLEKYRDNLKLFKGFVFQNISLYGDMSGDEDYLKLFFKNNTVKALGGAYGIGEQSVSIKHLGYDNLKFLDDITYDIRLVFWPHKHDDTPVDVYYAPLKNKYLYKILWQEPVYVVHDALLKGDAEKERKQLERIDKNLTKKFEV